MSKKDKKSKKEAGALGRARDRPQASAPVSLTMPLVRGLAGTQLQSNEMIYSAVTRIAGTLGTMPCHLYRGSQMMADDPLDALLSLRPNRRMSSFAFFRAMEAMRLTEGRAYAVKRFDSTGALRELVPYDPGCVTPLVDKTSGDVWYRIRREDDAFEYLHNWYVIALHHMSVDGMGSIRVTDVLRGAVQYAEDVRSFSLESIRGVNGGIVLEFPGTMGGDWRKRSVEEFIELYRASGGQVLALESGVTARMLTGTAIDPNAFDVEGVSRARIASVYNMSPYLLGESSAGSGKTTEQLTLEFLASPMHPTVTLYEQELSYKLLTPQRRREGWAIRFDMEAALRADSATLATLHQSQVRSGSRTPNEIRARDHMPPMPGGDVAYLSKDLAPMDLVAKGLTIDVNEINGGHNAAKA